MTAAGPVSILVENHRRFLAFLERRVGSREDAEDILQTAFGKSLERGSAIRDGERTVAWFYRLLRNAVADHYRRRARDEKASARARRIAPKPGSDPALERVVCGCVSELVRVLRPEHARILRRVDLEDAGVSAVANELGLTAGNARVRLHRARQALRRELERSCGTCAEHGCLDCTCSLKTGKKVAGRP